MQKNGSTSNVSRRLVSQRGMKKAFILSALFLIFNLAAVPVLGAKAQSGPNQPDAEKIVWVTQRADASENFYNMTDRSFRYDKDGTPRFAYGGDHLYRAGGKRFRRGNRNHEGQ